LTYRLLANVADGGSPLDGGRQRAVVDRDRRTERDDVGSGIEDELFDRVKTSLFVNSKLNCVVVDCGASPDGAPFTAYNALFKVVVTASSVVRSVKGSGCTSEPSMATSSCGCLN
jgi:hypothetical protein